MAILISAHEIKKTFTSRPLFEGVSFAIESGDRIGLIGPNGAGKSTLLKILAGQMTPEDGILSIQRGLKVGFLEQVPQFSKDATIESSVMEGAQNPHDWTEIAEAQKIMAKLSLSGRDLDPTETLIKTLSGGWQKRVALARELLKNPDIFLLDEPTNHLDIEGILWLEELLAHSRFATVTITHDRLFLQRIANKIMELDRRHGGGILTVSGDYAAFLETRENLMNAQELQEQKLKNTLRRETEWLRRGSLARQTKQQARIQNAGALKEEVEELAFRNRKNVLQIDFQSLEKNPKKLIEAKEISKSYNDVHIIPKLDILVTPKSRLGLLGSNGCGKSTLIRLLTGLEKPDSGSVFHAEKLKVAYFEQNRESLNPALSVFDTICPGGEYVDYRGTKVHVKSYLNRFLFSYEQMGLPVAKLSGGEQSRLLIARLMLKEANVLVLDEPTNDLDLATLQVLEEVLQEFNGAVIIVTHDRYFLDQVAKQIIAFGFDTRGERILVPLVGLDQWEAWYQSQPKIESTPQSSTETKLKNKSEATEVKKKKKLSYKDQRELDSMESFIEKAEAHLANLTAESTQPEVSSNAVRLLELTQALVAAQAEVDRLYKRWSELTQ